MLARETDYVVFDVETTGLSPLDGDRIIEIAALKIKAGKVADTFEQLINPEREIPVEAQRVHNISPDMLTNAPTSRTVLPQVIDFIGGACLVGHNVKFDMDFLCYELSLIGRKLRTETPAVDTLKMAKEFLPQLTSFRLSNLALALGVKVTTTHRALADVELTANVFSRLLDVADDRRLCAFQDIFKSFGVPKPVFRIAPVAQATLF